MSWRPRKIYWIITGNCNLHCSHCYIRTEKKQYGEFSINQVFYAIDKAVDLGVKTFFITGGEPFLRDDILTILRYIYDKGCIVDGLDTNATLLSSKVIDFLVEKNIYINISHDGVGFYDKNRNIRFENMLLSVCNDAIKSGVKVNINTIVTPNNTENILHLFDKLIRIDICQWLLFAPFYYGSYSVKYSALMVDAEIGLYDMLYKKWISHGRPFDIRLGNVFDSSKQPAKWKTYMCEYFRDTVALFPDGQITPCCKYIAHPSYEKFPNIFRDSVMDILQSCLLLEYKNQLMKDFLQNNVHCSLCRHLSKCNGGCRMDAFLESNNMWAKCERLCSLMCKIDNYE